MTAHSTQAGAVMKIQRWTPTPSPKKTNEKEKSMAKAKIVMSTVSVNPEMAQAFLGNNWDRNRFLRDSRVGGWKRDMESGNWRLSHQGIAFDKDGNLIDGQHRMSALAAIEDPEFTAEFTVFHYNVVCDALGVFDIGLARSAADGMVTTGIIERENSRMVASVAAALRSGISRSLTSPTHDEIRETLTTYRDELDWACEQSPATLTSPVRAAFAYAWPMDKAVVSKMWTTTATRVGMAAGSPELALTKAIEQSKNRGNRTGRNDLFAMALAAIMHKTQGRNIAHLATPQEDKTPVAISFFSSKRRGMGLPDGVALWTTRIDPARSSARSPRRS